MSKIFVLYTSDYGSTFSINSFDTKEEAIKDFMDSGYYPYQVKFIEGNELVLNLEVTTR
jgi:hypothetical protein